jgi:hypothetical protein
VLEVVPLTDFPGEPETDAWAAIGRPGSFVASHKDEVEGRVQCDDCEDVARDQQGEKEHIAGPECMLEDEEDDGYSGWNIGADEMRVRYLDSI